MPDIGGNEPSPRPDPERLLKAHPVRTGNDVAPESQSATLDTAEIGTPLSQRRSLEQVLSDSFIREVAFGIERCTHSRLSLFEARLGEHREAKESYEIAANKDSDWRQTLMGKVFGFLVPKPVPPTEPLRERYDYATISRLRSDYGTSTVFGPELDSRFKLACRSLAECSAIEEVMVRGPYGCYVDGYRLTEEGRNALEKAVTT